MDMKDCDRILSGKYNIEGITRRINGSIHIEIKHKKTYNTRLIPITDTEFECMIVRFAMQEKATNIRYNLG